MPTRLSDQRLTVADRHSGPGTTRVPELVQRWRRVAAVAFGIVLLLAMAYLGISAYFTTQATTAERHLPEGTPADLGLVYEPVTFASAVDHVPLRGWYLPARGERAVIMVHGINGNRWDAYHHMPELAAQLVRHGFDVLVFDLRAHGESGGEHIGLGWLERRDVQGAVSLVEQHGIAAGRIGLHGQSFGAATAMLATAADPDIAALVEDSGFADARDLLDGEIHAKTGLPPLFTPAIGLFGHLIYGLDLAAMPPVLAVPEIAPRPILFIHGEADARVPVTHAYRLKAASRNPADELWVVPGAGHLLSFAEHPTEYAAKVLAFYDRALSGGG